MHKIAFPPLSRKLRKSLMAFSIFISLETTALAEWDWSKTPSEATWEKFEKLSSQKKHKLWQSLASKTIDLDDMSWEWRLAWVRACAKSKESWCALLLQYGLFDKALIVRAESASILGRRLEGTGHPSALRLLETAYSIQQNNRHDAPLFIQYRILEAIKLIGGPASSTLGTRLAQSSESTARYWKVIRD